MLKIYNSLTRRKEDFVPINKDLVTMYTCGPTVYSYAHIGNLRSYITEDILQKTLEYVGYNVKRAMNITDIGHLSGDSDYGEDKMLSGAKKEHKTVLEIAKFYTEAFKKDCERLNIKWPEIVVSATSCVDRYIEMIKGLINKGYAYISEGNVYFDTSKLKEYYVFSNHNSDDLMTGVREGVEEDMGKRNKTDFALWFTKSKFADQELKWDSPWGYGYPGWHIECSGISLKYLGEDLDIHCGGVDNKFPHHTNEIAQSESYLGHKWCNYWFHVEHLNNETGKMAKSSGEFVTVDRLIEKGYDPLAYRLFCLQSHYQKPLLFSYDRLNGAVATYNRVKERIAAIQKENPGEFDNAQFEEYKQKFQSAIEDNLNTSMALAVLYDVLKQEMPASTKIKLIESFDTVLGLNLLKSEEQSIPEEIKKMAEERWQARLNKDWVKSDELRNKLANLGYIVKDSREGYALERQ